MEFLLPYLLPILVFYLTGCVLMAIVYAYIETEVDSYKQGYLSDKHILVGSFFMGLLWPFGIAAMLVGIYFSHAGARLVRKSRERKR